VARKAKWSNDGRKAQYHSVETDVYVDMDVDEDVDGRVGGGCVWKCRWITSLES